MNNIIKKISLLISLTIILVSFFIFPIKSVKAAGSFIVNSTADTDDATPGDGICDIGGGICTLRAAIEEANANTGADTITFDPTILPATTTPATTLPALTDADTTISGPGSGQFIIDGTSVIGDDGLKVQASGASISGLKIINFGQNGISISNTNTVSISNNTVNSNSQGGITLNNANNSTITGNTANNNSSNGAGLSLGGTPGSGGNTISGNTFNGDYFGILLTGANTNDNIIDGNTIDGTTDRPGVIIGMLADHNTFSNNTIDTTSANWDCIILTTDNNTVSGNTLTNCGQHGISINQLPGWGNGANNTISGNTITLANQNGVYIGEGGTPGADNSVTGNTIHNSGGDGIFVKNTNSVTVSSNTVYNNTWNGISFSNSNNDTILSNTVYSNGQFAPYQATVNYITWDDGVHGSLSYLSSNGGISRGINFLIGSTYTLAAHNGDPITGLDGNQDLYLALVTDDPTDYSNNNQYTFYTDKSQADFLTWCQANVNVLCNIDYYSTGAPIWQSHGAGNNYTWNAAALPSGGTVNTSYYTSSILSVNYGGNDYNQAFLFGPGIPPVVFYVGGDPFVGGVFNFLVSGITDTAFGFDGTTNLDLVLIDDGGTFMGKSGWVVPSGLDVVGIFTALGVPGASQICRESDVFTAHGDANDYTFEPIASWTGCAGATMSAGFADPATMIGHSANPPSLNPGSYAYAGIDLQNSNSNTFTSNTLTSNGNTYIIGGTSNGNTFTDDINTTPLGFDYKYSSSGNNAINNVDITANGSNGQNTGSGTLSVYYKARAFVHNGQNIPIASAPVSFKDSGEMERASDTTDIGGYTAYHLLLSYTQTSTVFNSYNDYSVVVDAPGYSPLTQKSTINSTNITVEAVPGIPPTYSPAPVPTPPVAPPITPPITPPPITPPVENPPTENPPANPIVQPVVCSDTLSQVQATPIPEFNPDWGLPDRINWALQHRENIYGLYVKYFLRQPCATEVNWWLQTEPNIDAIRENFLNSDEYLKNNPNAKPLEMISNPNAFNGSNIYVVQAGDYLKLIAEKVYGDANRYQDIIDLNKTRYPTLLIDPGLLYVGWQLSY